MKFEIQIAIDDKLQDKKITELLAEQSALSTALIKQAMTKGAVWLKSASGGKVRRIRRAGNKAKLGDTIYLYYDHEVLNQQPQTAELISDQGSYSLWNKPQGMLCQGSKWGDHCTINRWAETQLEPQRPAFIVHRLDRAASGLILIAHKKKTATYFADLFEKRQIEKHYRATVIGEFPQEQEFNKDLDGKSAFTTAKLSKFDKSANTSYLDIQIETGRKHQIRKHLSEAGFPILGDRLYGDEQSTENASDLHLISYYLAFQCPEELCKKEFNLV